MLAAEQVQLITELLAQLELVALELHQKQQQVGQEQ
jgi:hypothetical protein